MRSWRPSLRSCCSNEKLRDAVGIFGHQFAVDQSRLGRQLGDRVGDAREFCGPVEALAGQQLDLAVVEPRLQAVAVELDLVDPVAARRAPCRPASPGTARRKRAGRLLARPEAPSSAICRLCAKVVRQSSRRLPALSFGRRLGACGGLFRRFVRRARPFAAGSCQTLFDRVAISSMVRPDATDSGFSSRISFCFRGARGVVRLLDQQPVVALFAGPPAHAHQVPAAL